MKSSGAMPMSSIEVLPFWRRVLWKIERSWQITGQLKVRPPTSYEFRAGVVCMADSAECPMLATPDRPTKRKRRVRTTFHECSYKCCYLGVGGTQRYRQ